MPRFAHSREFTVLSAAAPVDVNHGLKVDVPQLDKLVADCEADRTIKGLLLDRAKAVLDVLIVKQGPHPLLEVGSIEIEGEDDNLRKHIQKALREKHLKKFVEDSTANLDVAKQVFFDREWAPKTNEATAVDNYVEVRRDALLLSPHPPSRTPCTPLLA
jgi:hypothetical protein